MKRVKRIAIALTMIVAAFATAAAAQTRSVTFVSNSYDLKVQQFSAGTSAAGDRYVSFAGEGRAVNNKLAADLKTFAFTISYAVDRSGAITVTDGTFLIQTTNKDRSTLTVGGDILPGATLSLRSGGLLAAGQKLSLALVGNEGTQVSGVINVSADKSTPPRLVGTLSLTYPVVQ